MIYRENSKVSPVSVPVSSLFESTICELSGPTPAIFTTVYRPLNRIVNFLTTLMFFSPIYG